MSNNPITHIRFWGNIALIAVIIIAIGSSFLAETPWTGWPWLIGAVAIGYAAFSFAAHLLFPTKIDAAWDEQNMTAHRASLAFGYWATLAVFLLLLGAVWTDRVDPGTAFFWFGPVLAIAPAVHYLTSIVRGRAE